MVLYTRRLIIAGAGVSTAFALVGCSQSKSKIGDVVDIDGHTYRKLPDNALRAHLVTPEGVKYEVMPSGKGLFNIEAFGARPILENDPDKASIQASNHTAITAALAAGDIFIPDANSSSFKNHVDKVQDEDLTQAYYFTDPIVVLNQRQVFGAGQWKNGLRGNSLTPLLTIGDGTNKGNRRKQKIFQLNVKNDNGTAVLLDRAANVSIVHCTFQGRKGNGLEGYNAVRGEFRSCFFGTSSHSDGPGAPMRTALQLLDNCNGIKIDNCTITGGKGGRAVVIGRSYAISLTNFIIESSLHGIWLASSEHDLDGNVNAIEVTGGTIEQSSTPLVLGDRFSLSACNIHSNYFSNAKTNVIPVRHQHIRMGRCRAMTIKNNVFGFAVAENFISFNIAKAGRGFYQGIDISDNVFVNNAPANYLVKTGMYASNNSMNAVIGGQNYFDFGGNKRPRGPQIWKHRFKVGQDLTLRFHEPDTQTYFGGLIHAVKIRNVTGNIEQMHIQIGKKKNKSLNVVKQQVVAGDLTVKVDDLTGVIEDFNAVRVFGSGDKGAFDVEIIYTVN